MNRKQIFELEKEYLLRDIRGGIKDKGTLIERSKLRKLIPANLRALWEEKCFITAMKELNE